MFSPVVSYSISTSNHNLMQIQSVFSIVVSYSISTSNHNRELNAIYEPLLYLIPFLHQTTTLVSRAIAKLGCILFHFYIKPQQAGGSRHKSGVVSYSISTSNHNLYQNTAQNLSVVSYSISTSNHNSWKVTPKQAKVVSYSISTSNHNPTNQDINPMRVVSYSISTSNHNLEFTRAMPSYVVSYSISTSNHNQFADYLTTFVVVSYSISTSNHNLWRIRRYFQAHYHLNHILIFNGML